MGLQIFDLIPNTISSEYLPDQENPYSGRAIHQDLCSLTLPDASRDLVICNELFEHLYDLPAGLGHMARVLVAGGKLVGTFPFAYNRETTITKAVHRPDGEPELLTEIELHGDPVNPEGGSLVFQIPGWDLLDRCRSAGFSKALIHWIAAPSYGVVGADTPAVLVLEATR
jgi:SAM-dependent methyltransferase